MMTLVNPIVLLCALVALVVASIITTITPVQAQSDPLIGIPFPDITSESLAGNEVKLPDAAKDKVTLITIAFQEAGQPFIDSWAEPYLEKYGNESTFSYFEVPMINILNPQAQQYIDDGMRAGINQNMHPNVVTYYGNFSEYQTKLQMPNVLSAYVYLLDQDGIIRYHGSGKMTKENWEELSKVIEKLRS